MWREPELTEVPVAGGALTVGRWGSGSRVVSSAGRDGRLVLASHGITANHRSFGTLAAVLAERHADVSLVAVDHRGRGGSADLPGPYGMRAHARDLLAVLDHFGADDAVLVGHSMGAFVAVNAAELAPERVSGLVLVDGGLPIEVPLPPDTDLEEVVRSVIGPALDRLDLTFDSPEAYLDRWREHPAFQGDNFNDVAEAYFAYDLVRDGDTWRSPVSKAAVLEDGKGPLQPGPERTALERVDVPATVLWAPRGLLDQMPGLYAPAVIEATAARLPRVRFEAVDDVNHYSVLLGRPGADAVADAIARHLD